MLSRGITRSIRSLRSVAPLPRRVVIAPIRKISTSIPRYEITALSTRLAEEIKYEAENSQTTEPEFLTNFKANGVWTIEDKAGADEVTLIRSYGNETIKVVFSIGDIDAEQEDDDQVFANDEESEETDAATEGEAEDKAEPVEDDTSSFPVRAAITVTKAGAPGALSIDAVAQDGMFTIDNISFYNDADLANDLTSEGDWKRRGLYIGPDFDNLDENVQAEFESFLEERGVNSSLALLIPEFAEHKEQQEYLTWLQSVKGFLEK